MKTVKKVSAYLFLLAVFNVAYGAEVDEIRDSTIKTTIPSIEVYEDEPVFDTDTLTVPSVSSSGKPGLYQDAVFKLQEDGTWLLQDAVEGRLFYLLYDVEFVQTDSLPKQAFLKISGYDHGCYREGLGKVKIQETDNVFNISVYYPNYDIPDSPEYTCTADVTEFTSTIQIPIFGLPAGDYSYVVNDEFTGTFSLELDNELAP